MNNREVMQVAWRTFDGEGGYDYTTYDDDTADYAEEWNKRNPRHVGWVEPLYLHPAPQRQPLSDAEVYDLYRAMVKGGKSMNWLCRAIERAHGIGGQE